MKILNELTRDYYKAIVLIFASQFILLSVFFNNTIMARHNFFQPENELQFEFSMGMFIFALNFTAAMICRGMYKKSRKEQEYKANELRIQHIEEQNQVYRQHHHDSRNHLTIIALMAGLDKTNELKRYVSVYSDVIDISGNDIDTGIVELDLLLYAKVCDAKAKKIEVKYECNVKLSCPTYYVVILVSIFGNVFDNAIEAASKVEEGKLKEIEFFIEDDPCDIVFCVMNTYTGEKIAPEKLEEGGFTSKEEGDHGHGLKIISRLVKKMGGIVRFEMNDTHFITEIQIPTHILKDVKQCQV